MLLIVLIILQETGLTTDDLLGDLMWVLLWFGLIMLVRLWLKKEGGG
jgi:hypothetical protein